MKHFKKSALATSITLILAGCGSGSDSAPSVNNPGSGSITKVSSSGVITGFGSIYVNGVRYATDDAEVEFEGEGLKSEEDLRLGMRVEIEADQDDDGRRATRVVFDKDLKGPVSSVSPTPEDSTLGTLVVLGQTVTVDANTVLSSTIVDTNFDGQIDLHDLSTTEGRIVIEVSGFPTDEGFIATRLERLNGNDDSDDDNQAEVKGVIVGLDTAAGTFMIRNLLVHYELVALDDDLQDDQLSNGWYVEVEGEVQADGSLQATKIEREDDRWEDDDEREGEFEIEGIIQAVDTESTPNTVTINGVVVPMADASLLINLVGTKVELEGSFNSEGRLELDNDDGIQQARTNEVEVFDRVETVSTLSFTTRLGVSITPTGLSRVEDDDDDSGDRLKPADFIARLQVGDSIEARGYIADDGTIIWSRIERDNDDDDQDCSLRGPVDVGSIDVTSATFTVLGVTIDGSQVNDDSFGDDDDSSLGRANFFSILSGGAVVEAQSDEGDTSACSDGLLIADEVEFESDDDVETTSDQDDVSDDEEDDDSQSEDDLDDDNSNQI
jgi:hypothetical protein